MESRGRSRRVPDEEAPNAHSRRCRTFGRLEGMFRFVFFLSFLLLLPPPGLVRLRLLKSMILLSALEHRAGCWSCHDKAIRVFARNLAWSRGAFFKNSGYTRKNKRINGSYESRSVLCDISVLRLLLCSVPIVP